MTQAIVRLLLRLYFGFGMVLSVFVCNRGLELANDSPWISTKEAADIIGVHTDWLRDRQNEIGTGPDFFCIGNRKQYRRDDVEKWLEAQRNKKP